MIDFLGSLSWFGWISMSLWFILPILTVWGNRDWFFDFDERKPELNFVTELVSEWGMEGIFMVIRYFILQLMLMVIGYTLAVMTMIE